MKAGKIAAVLLTACLLAACSQQTNEADAPEIQM